MFYVVCFYYNFILAHSYDYYPLLHIRDRAIWRCLPDLIQSTSRALVYSRTAEDIQKKGKVIIVQPCPLLSTHLNSTLEPVRENAAPHSFKVAARSQNN